MPDNRNQGQNWIRLDLRLAIYLRDGMTCVWCRRAGTCLGYGLTLDHVGRSNKPFDLVTSCNACNAARGSRALTLAQEAHVGEFRYRTLDRSAGAALIERRRAAKQNLSRAAA